MEYFNEVLQQIRSHEAYRNAAVAVDESLAQIVVHPVVLQMKGWIQNLADWEVPWMQIALAIMLVAYCWETYLKSRQHQKLKDNQLPKTVAKFFKQADFNKSRSYGLDKSHFAFVSDLWNEAQQVAVFAFAFLPWAWAFSADIIAYTGYNNSSEILQSLVFAAFAGVLSTLLNVPFSLYYTFVIEAKHGFNKQTLGLYVMDTLKSIALGLAIGLPFLAMFLYIIKWAGTSFFFHLWLFMACFTIFLNTMYPVLIQPLFNKFTPFPEGELKNKIELLCKRIQFPLGKIFVIDGSKRSSHSNAYFYGLFTDKTIVVYDTLLEQSSNDEIVAIIGHELGHWHMNHQWKRLLAVQVHMFALFYVFSLCINLDSLYTSFGFDSKPTFIGFVLFQYIYSPVELMAGFLMNVLSRKHEYEADLYAKKLGFGTNLKSGLIKLHLKNLGNLNPDSLYSIWHYSHPTLVERLAALAKE